MKCMSLLRLIESRSVECMYESAGRIIYGLHESDAWASQLKWVDTCTPSFVYLLTGSCVRFSHRAGPR